MKACWCILPSVDPNACQNCSNYENITTTGNDYLPYPYEPTSVPQPIYPSKTVKRVTKTIEKYGPDGEYLGKEVITTDKEDIQAQDWGYSGTITASSIGGIINNISSSCEGWDVNSSNVIFQN
jgi:hypothetical protein